ncbi:MAG: type III pantothenate kinase [Elusimicrobiota bacterium]
MRLGIFPNLLRQRRTYSVISDFGSMKLLAIDVGNTIINFGLFSALAKGEFLPDPPVAGQAGENDRGFTCGGDNKELTKIKILTTKFAKIPFSDYDIAIISSVVPDLTPKIKKNLKNSIVVNHKNIPIKIKLINPGEVGSDRLVNAVAVKELYGVPSVVIDLGTATTFDIVSENGEYIGGVIAPGVRISAESLSEKTAKLPKVSFRVPMKSGRRNLVVGKNTKEAILAGIFYGQVGLIREVIKRIRSSPSRFACGEEFGVRRLKVVLTGGYANFFAAHFPDFIVDEDLTLKGLKIIFEKLTLR